MSTTTLPKRPAKEVVNELPEQLYPCRTQLSKLLAEHAAITAGIEEFENRLSRAELDLNFAIENDSDQDIDRHQSALSVFNLKLSAKRSNLTKLLASIPAAISSASNEYSSLLLAERERRIWILGKRIAETLGTDPERMIQGHFFDDVLDQSKPVQEIDMMRLNFNLIGASDETVLASAKTLLACFDEILRAGKETI